MAFLWVLCGVGIAWFIFNFRATKRATRQQANLEFAAFIHALDAWNEDRADFDSQMDALHHFEVYDTRRADFVRDPTGRTIPAMRAVLSQCWVKHLTDSRLVDSQGTPSRWNAGAASFWDTIEALHRERESLLRQDPFTPTVARGG